MTRFFPSATQVRKGKSLRFVAELLLDVLVCHNSFYLVRGIANWVVFMSVAGLYTRSVSGEMAAHTYKMVLAVEQCYDKFTRPFSLCFSLGSGSVPFTSTTFIYQPTVTQGYKTCRVYGEQYSTLFYTSMFLTYCGISFFSCLFYDSFYQYPKISMMSKL